MKSFFMWFISLFTHRYERIRLIPRAKGRPIPVRQMLWLWIIWRTYESSDAKLSKLKQEVLEANATIHQKMKEIELEEQRVKRDLDVTANYGDQLYATGPVVVKKGSPFSLTRAPFYADPGPAFDDWAKAWKKGGSTAPHNFAPWPPPGTKGLTGGSKTAYLLEDQYTFATSTGVVVKGRDADELMAYKKPQQQQQQGRKKGGNQNNQNNQQQGNQGGGNN